MHDFEPVSLDREPRHEKVFFYSGLMDMVWYDLENELCFNMPVDDRMI